MFIAQRKNVSTRKVHFFVSQGSFEYLKLTYVIYKTC